MNYKLFSDNINDYFYNVKQRSWTETPVACKQHQELNVSVSQRMPTDSELQKRMQTRVKIMQHGCKYLDIIEKLMTSKETKINQLLNFHQSIYELKQPLERVTMKRKSCRIAFKNISSIKLGKISKVTSIWSKLKQYRYYFDSLVHSVRIGLLRTYFSILDIFAVDDM